MNPNTIAVGVTGGSGVIIARRLIEELTSREIHVELCRSRSARMVVADELPGSTEEPGRSDGLLRGLPGELITEWKEQDYRAPFASGSSLIRGMVIVPCSMATLGAIAHGIADNLIRRGADVMLKEQRPLVLVPREAPMSVIHLQNQVIVAQAGAIVLPPVLTFYQAPGPDVGAQVDFIVSRILDQFGIANDLVPRWGASGTARGM